MNTDNLIERLGRDARVTPLPGAGIRTAAWSAWAALYMIVGAAAMLAASARAPAAITPLYLLQQSAALMTALVAARMAFASVVPGSRGPNRVLLVAPAAIWVLSLAWEAVLNVPSRGTLGIGSETDWPCVLSMTIGGAVLGGPMIWMLRRGAPLTPAKTGALAALAALSLANIEACLLRPHAFAITVLLWHGTVIAVAAGLFGWMSRRWLPWPMVRT